MYIGNEHCARVIYADGRIEQFRDNRDAYCLWLNAPRSAFRAIGDGTPIQRHEFYAE